MPISRSSLRKNLFKSLENIIDIKPQLEYGTEELIIESVKRNMGVGYVVKGETLKIDKNKKVSLKQGQKAFKQLRKEAKKNGLQDMSLDEINAEIKAYRQERRAALAVAEGK